MTQPLITPYPIRLDMYHQMIALGILGEDEPVELIRGQLVHMSPKGSKHAACIAKVNDWLTPRLTDKAQLRIQDPIQIPDLSEPEPDLVLVSHRADYYATAHPLPSDVLLLIEVADSSLRIDREVKMQVYAEAGIAVYWIINLPERVMECYEQPSSEGFGTVRVIKPEETRLIPSLGIEVMVADWMI